MLLPAEASRDWAGSVGRNLDLSWLSFKFLRQKSVGFHLQRQISNVALWVCGFISFDAFSTAKEKPLTFTRKIRGLFGGAGGI